METAAVMSKSFMKDMETPAPVCAERNLLQVDPGTYTVKKIDTSDEDMNSFLFRLGCYSGERITVISRKKNSCIVVIKDGRYSLDAMLANAIIV